MKKSFYILLTLVLALLFVGCDSDKISETETTPTTEISYTIETESPYIVINDLPTATLSVTEISSDNKTITVVFSYSGENKLCYGEQYKIEVQKDNKWYSLKESETFISDVGYIVESGQTCTASYHLSRFGTLTSGHYRIVVMVTDQIEDGNNTHHNLSVEFDIE